MIEWIFNRIDTLSAYSASVSKSNKLYLLLSCMCTFVLLASCLYGSIQATSVQMHNGDQFISAAIFSPEYGDGTPMIAQGHTNVFKIPFLALQSILPQEELVYAVANAVFVFLSFVAWSYIMSRIFGKRAFPLMMATFAAIIVNSPQMAIDMSMITIRHIEYPLALLFAVVFINSPLKSTNRLFYVLTMTLLLSLLILNDNYFLYVLVVPLVCILFIRLIRYGPRQGILLDSILILTVGTVVAKIIGKVLTATNLLSISPGYAEGTRIIQLDSIIPSIILALQQTLDLFGALIFGQEIRKSNLSIALLFIVFMISVTAAVQLARKVSNAKGNETHMFLLITLVLAYAAYIIPGFAAPSASRYLTVVIFILVSLFAYYVVNKSVRLPLIYPIAIIAMFMTTALAIPRVGEFYTGTRVQVDRDRARTQKTVSAMQQQNTDILLSGGGHFSLWFESDGKIPIAQMDTQCNTPTKWANNSEWLKSTDTATKSAYLVDTTYPEPSSLRCSIAEVKATYGPPADIIPIPKPDEKASDTSTYLLIYDYDIRSKLIN